MWLMILIAVHINDPQDQPGKVEMQFPDQQTCQQALNTIKWQLKFKNFNWKGNEIRFLFLGLSIVLLSVLHLIAIPLIIILYILISIVSGFIKPTISE